ncbi:hypothetical protein SRHO_G00142850 [Serrasalmus rhombeus]
MRLQVTLALICVLFSKALTLKCYECMPELFGHCKETKTDCPDQCDSKTVVVNMGGIEHEVNIRTCGAAEECDTGSLNLGALKMTVNSKCCSTDLCNSQKVPALPKGSPNGKKCYTCADADKNCLETLSCEGSEDHCLSATVNTAGLKLTMKGCASRSFCTADSSSMQEAGINGDWSCCEGNLCNSAAGVQLSLLMLLSSLSTIRLRHTVPHFFPKYLFKNVEFCFTG